MGWNQPNEMRRGESRCQKSGNTIRWALAGVLIVVLGGITAWMILGRSGDSTRKSPDDPQEPLSIADKGSSVAPKSDHAGKKVHSADEKKSRPTVVRTQTYVDAQGIERYPGGARVPRQNAKRVAMPDRRAVKWKYDSEDTICTLLQMEPGDIIVGDAVYGEQFVRDFKNSLKEEIKIEPDDDWYQRQLKEDVIAAKKELVEAMNRGEDIAAIMTSTRKEMRELFEYRQQLVSDVS